MDRLEGINPRSYLLSKDIRESFESIFTHPYTGAFMDMRHVVVSRAIPKTRPSRSAKIGLSLLHAATEKLCDDSNMSLDSTIVCHQCSKTNINIVQSSFLSSNTIADTFPIVQKQRSELIKCDYCPLHWHIDCLTPPLASIPNELLDDEIEWVDQGEISILKSGLWNGRSPLDQRTRFNPKVPMPRETLSYQDMYALSEASVGSPMLATYRCVTIRRKWMCPCHADWSTPKLKARDVDEKSDIKWLGTHDELLSSASNSAQTKLKIRFKQEPNNGHIDIQNDPATIAFFSPTKTIVPERQVQFDFLKRITPRMHHGKLSNTNLFPKLKEFDTKYTSRLASTAAKPFVYQDQLDLIMAGEPISAEMSEVITSLMQHVGALLLVGLDAYSRAFTE